MESSKERRERNTRENFGRRTLFAVLMLQKLGRVSTLDQLDWVSVPSGLDWASASSELRFSYKLTLFMGKEKHANMFCHSSSSPLRMFPRCLGKGYAQAPTTFLATRRKAIVGRRDRRREISLPTFPTPQKGVF